MTRLWFYDLMSKLTHLSYRAKIMIMAFLGTHIPLIALSVHFGVQQAPDWGAALWALGVTLAATLAGTAFTLFVLDQLLRPVVLTAAALRDYRTDRILPSLPSFHADEAGTLMADAQRMITTLDASLLRLERYDSATGVLNRPGFLRVLADPGLRLSVVAMVRLVNHENIATSLDQAVATDVLVQVLGRLRDRLGPDARLARIADADLAFLVPFDPVQGAHAPGDALDDVAAVLRRLVAQLDAPVDAGGLRLAPVLVAGLALHQGGDAGEVTLDNAATALVSADADNPVTAHTTALRDKMRARFLLEQDLRAAIRNEEFELHFQPVMDVSAGRPVGAEALIRWNCPTRGMVPPGAFIPVAEASGLIEPIGLWVLREACRQVAGWDGGMRVAINLGARQFIDEDLVWHVREAIEAAGISPRQLEIELTESVAMVDHDHTRRTFGNLRDMGVQIAIDDFGTGFSSMSTLRKLPFNKLKIDREFVTDVHLSPGSQAMCSAMIALGQGLGLQVLAEGTEKAEEVAFLRNRGCSLFQGYYFARPVPGTSLAATFAGLNAPLGKVVVH